MTEVEGSYLAAAFGARNTAEIEARHADWADTYDAETAAAGYRTPQLRAAFVARHVPRDATPILDAGCGTGLAGDCLSVLGFRGLVGLGPSEPMLARARARGAYDALLRMELGGPSTCPTAASPRWSRAGRSPKAARRPRASTS